MRINLAEVNDVNPVLIPCVIYHEDICQDSSDYVFIPKYYHKNKNKIKMIQTVCANTCLDVCMCLFIYVCVCVCVCVFTSVRMGVQVHACIRVCKDTQEVMLPSLAHLYIKFPSLHCPVKSAALPVTIAELSSSKYQWC